MKEKPSAIQELLDGKVNLVVTSTPSDNSAVRPFSLTTAKFDPQERELADFLISLTQKYGKFDQIGDGVWAGYLSPSENWVKDIGVKCANCVMWEGGSSCKIIALPVEPEGKCRFAVIPNGVVKKK
jgi:hypothetical protein